MRNSWSNELRGKLPLQPPDQPNTLFSEGKQRVRFNSYISSSVHEASASCGSSNRVHADRELSMILSVLQLLVVAGLYMEREAWVWLLASQLRRLCYTDKQATQELQSSLIQVTQQNNTVKSSTAAGISNRKTKKLHTVVTHSKQTVVCTSH